jgi:hypothetical protein
MNMVILQWVNGVDVDVSLSLTIAFGILLGGILLVLLSFAGTCLDALIRHFEIEDTVKSFYHKIIQRKE